MAEVNPKTNERVLADRRELFVNYDLPMREDYNRFISEIIDRNEEQKRQE